MQLRRLTQVQPARAGEGAGRAAAHDRGARRDPRRRQAAAQGRLRRAGRGREDLRHPPPHGPAGVRRHHRHLGGRAARGRRRPVLRVPVLHRAAGPLAHRRGRRAPAAAGPTTTSSSRRCAPRARGEIGVVTSPRPGASSSASSTCPTIPASANDPNLQGGVPLSEVLSLEPGERVLALCRAARRRPRPRARHPAGRGQAGQPRGALAATSGRSSGSRTATRSSARSSWPPARETLCFITSDAQLLHFGADARAPAGPLRRRHRRRPARPPASASCGSAPLDPTPDGRSS